MSTQIVSGTQENKLTDSPFALYILIAIITLSFLVRFFTLKVAWVDGDEGNYLYDAKLMLEGFVPFKDYVTRSPLYLCLLAISIKLFGTTLTAGRVVSLISSVGTTVLLYFLAKELYNKRTGLAAALIYALLPFTVFWSSIIKTEPTVAILNMLAIYLFVLGLKRRNNFFIICGGAVVALAILVRESALGLLVIQVTFAYVYLSFQSKSSFKRKLSSTLSIALHIMAGILFVYVLILIIAVSFGLFDSIAPFFSKFRGLLHNRSSNLFSLHALHHVRDGFLNLISTSLVEGFLEELAGPLVLGLLFIALALKGGRSRLSVFLTSLFCIGFGFFAYKVVTTHLLGLYPRYRFLLLFLLLVATIAVIYFHQAPNLFASNALMLVWLVTYCCIYITHHKFHLMYFYEIMPVLCIMIAATFTTTVDVRFKDVLVSAMLFTLLISSFFTLKYYYSTHGLFRSWSPHTVFKVSEYLQSMTEENDEIFTGSTIFVFCASRRLVRNISHPILYRDFSEEELHSLGYPSPEEIMKYMARERVRYVINDRRTWTCFYKRYPKLELFVDKNYFLEKRIDNTEIRRLVD